MRKPLVFFLIILSLWVWSLDLVDTLFFYVKTAYTKTTGSLIALIPFSILTWLFTKLFFKYYGLKKESIRITKKGMIEFVCLLIFFSPVLYLNFTRIMFPDTTFDVGAYHLYLQELNRYENLENFNMVGGAGGGTYFFTLSYKMFGFFRHLLGFRMGVAFNSLLLFMCYISLYDFIKLATKTCAEKLRIPIVLIALSSLFIIYADNTLFVLNAYVVDLLGIPLLLELVMIILFKKLTDENSFTVTLFFFFLASLLVAFKLTYLPYLLILGLCFIICNYFYLIKKKKIILLGFVTLLFPSIYLVYNYTETLNPIFPFYNKLFQSSLYPLENFRDHRWGPRNFLETFYYNIICATDANRNNEWEFFSVRLLAEYFIILCCSVTLVYKKFRLTDPFIKLIIAISGIALSLNYMLLLTTGYYRYGIIIEMLFGLCIILWLLYFIQIKNYITFSAVLILSLLQCKSTFNRIYMIGTNLSWYSYDNLLHEINRSQQKKQKHLLFRDRQTAVDPAISRLGIDGFLSSECDGYGKLISPNTPIYNVTSYGQRKEMIKEFERNTLDTLSQRHNLYYISRMENFWLKIRELNARNYFVDSIVNIYPTFTGEQIPMYLFKIKHYNADSFKINTLDSFTRDNSTTGKQEISFNLKNNYKLFVVLDPYTYNWQYPGDSAKFKLNDSSYMLKLSDQDKRILTLQGNDQLSFHKLLNEFNYILIIQQLAALNKQE